MRLTLILLRKKMPNGNIYRGKHRIVRPVTNLDAARARNDYAIEENNMLYLRHPYLTMEQSSGHAKALGKHETWIKEWRINRLQERNIRENVSISDHLSHLQYKEAWD